jgi:hypothetical protein
VLLFKAVNLFNRFKKCKFLAPTGETKKHYFARSESNEKKITGEKTKLVYITEDINLFTLKIIRQTLISVRETLIKGLDLKSFVSKIM